VIKPFSYPSSLRRGRPGAIFRSQDKDNILGFLLSTVFNKSRGDTFTNITYLILISLISKVKTIVGKKQHCQGRGEERDFQRIPLSYI